MFTANAFSETLRSDVKSSETTSTRVSLIKKKKKNLKVKIELNDIFLEESRYVLEHLYWMNRRFKKTYKKRHIGIST